MPPLDSILKKAASSQFAIASTAECCPCSFDLCPAPKPWGVAVTREESFGWCHQQTRRASRLRVGPLRPGLPPAVVDSRERDRASNLPEPVGTPVGPTYRKPRPCHLVCCWRANPWRIPLSRTRNKMQKRSGKALQWRTPKRISPTVSSSLSLTLQKNKLPNHPMSVHSTQQ